jgi:hypothetical protein
MDNDKSIFEKITDKVKEITEIASQSAQKALAAEEPHQKPDEPLANYIPLAADGFVSDPLMVPPLAVAPARQRRHAGAAPKARAGEKTAKAPRSSSGRASKRRTAKTAKAKTARAKAAAAEAERAKATEARVARARAAKARAAKTRSAAAKAASKSTKRTSRGKTSRRAAGKVASKSRTSRR